MTFGADTTEAYNATSNLKPHESFNGMLSAFSKLTANDGVRLQDGLTRISTQKVAGCRRYTYHMAGRGAYRDFVKLILDLQKERMPCSFNRIQLSAWNDANIAIDAEIVFTLLD